ncbi:MAG TPA: DUF3025 domain-containing protein [Burkholderiales bacterium]
MRPWLERLGAERSLERLNRLSDELNVRTASGHPVRFVPPEASDPYYEVQLYETGRVQTRADNPHDLFNALAWLTFPRTKALINALHADEIPRERGRRGRRRDLLTLLDEGGAIVQCDDAELIALVRGFRWKELFWERRGRVLERMRLRILGHATLEQALNPWPGIACKAIFVPAAANPDAAAEAWLAALEPDTNPRTLPPLPIFGYPGWMAGSEHSAFYEDRRYFREKQDRAAPVRPAPPRDGAH